MMTDCQYTIAMDPGVATGIAVWDHEADGIDWGLTGQYDELELYRTLDSLLQNVSLCETRIETFAITSATLKKARQLEPIWITGWLRAECMLLDIPVSWSKPADVMKRFPDASLKQAGWYHKSEHARDALRHLAHCLTKTAVVDAAAFIL